MDWTRLWSTLLVLMAELLTFIHSKKIVCAGTSDSLSLSGTASFRYNRLKWKYANCTHVQGNLEITWLDDPTLTYDLSFLNTIEEVSGYILVAYSYAEVIDLRNLRIIRGQELFSVPSLSYKEYSLYLAKNWEPSLSGVGLKQLWLPKLRVIMAGDVQILDCPLLCFTKHILWRDILQDPAQKVVQRLERKYREFRTGYCPACDYSCPIYQGIPRCWGPGPKLCQKLHGEICSPQCGDRHCYGMIDDQCCHQECSGGCTGPTNKDCTTCKHVVDDGACVPRCPPRVIYDPNQYVFHPNPRGKYQYGHECVVQCPVHLVRNGDTCVIACPAGMLESGGDCIPCKHDECHKHCDGNINDFVSESTIDAFKDCVVVENNLRLLWNSFEGDTFHNVGPLTLSKLEYLSSIREVRGHVAVHMPPWMAGKVDDLSFLRNLEVIRGRDLYPVMRSGAALLVTGTPLKKLGLTKLHEIDAGSVYLFRNPELCFVDTVQWERIFMGQNQIMDNDLPEETCRERGFVCHKECDGCWGPGQDECQRCTNFKIGDSCVDSCLRAKNYYPVQDDFICKQCDWRCRSGCNGPTKEDCLL